MYRYSNVSDVDSSKDEVVVDINIYSSSSERSSICPSPSFEPLGSNRMKWSRMSFTSLIKHRTTGGPMVRPSTPHFIQQTAQPPASPQQIGILLAQFSLAVPTSHPFSKVIGGHELKVEVRDKSHRPSTVSIGRIQLQMGVFDDVVYIPKPVI